MEVVPQVESKILFAATATLLSHSLRTDLATRSSTPIATSVAVQTKTQTQKKK